MADSPFRIGARNGILPLCLLTVLLIIIIELVSFAPLRYALGFLFVLFFPGYTLVLALFPQKERLGNVERTALTLGMSVAIVPLLGLLLNYTHWGITVSSILWAVAIFIFILSAVACYRQRRLEPEQRFTLDFPRFKPDWSTSKRSIALSAVLVLTIVGAVWMMASVIATPREGEKFTEFYLLGSVGQATGYPSQLALDEEGIVIVGVINNEQQQADYRVTVGIDGKNIIEIASFSLPDGETWEQKVAITPYKLGPDQKVEFLLYKDAALEPYRNLHIWIDVGITS